MPIATFFSILLIIFIWSLFGLIIYAVLLGEKEINLFDSLNPIYIYRTYQVNIFGTIMLFIVFNLICPVGTIMYWFYKLCTVGRR